MRNFFRSTILSVLFLLCNAIPAETVKHGILSEHGRPVTDVTHIGMVERHVEHFALSSDGKKIGYLTNTYQQVCEFKIATQTDECVDFDDIQSPRKIFYSADDSTILLLTVREIHFINVEKKTQKLFRSRELDRAEVALSPDHQVLATQSSSGMISIFDLNTLKTIAVWRSPLVATGFFLDKNRRLTTMDYAGNVRRYEIGRAEAVHVFKVPGEEAFSSSLSPDGEYLATKSNQPSVNRIRFWEIRTGKVVTTIQSAGTNRFSDFLKYGPYFRETEFHRCVSRVWNYKTGELIQEFGPSTECLNLTRGPRDELVNVDYRFFAAGRHSRFTMRTWKGPDTSSPMKSIANRLTFTRDGITLGAVSDTAAAQWRIPTLNGLTTQILPKLSDRRALAFDSSGSLVTELSPLVWGAWDPNRQVGLKPFPLAGGESFYPSQALVSLKNGSWLVVNFVRKFEATKEEMTIKEELAFMFNQHVGQFAHLKGKREWFTGEISHNGDTLFFKHFFTDEIPPKSTALYRPVSSDSGLSHFSAAAVTPDWKLAIVAKRDGSIGLLDVRSGQWISHIREGAREASAIAASPNGKNFAVTYEDGVVEYRDIAQTFQRRLSKSKEIGAPDWEEFRRSAPSAYAVFFCPSRKAGRNAQLDRKKCRLETPRKFQTTRG